ncbi:MAG TPA: DUF5719 family protein [Candidatus Nanopelagicaceae bacterium]
MNFRRAGVLVIVLTATLVLGQFATKVTGTKKYSESFPAVACPPTGSGLTSQVSTGSTSTPYRKLTGKVLGLAPVKNSRFAIVSDPILLDAGNVTSVVWQSLAGIWAGATLCTSPQGEQWFVGGAGDVTSKSRLIVINSGLSAAIVDVAIWSEKGAQLGKVLTVRANSYVQVGLDSIAAGQGRLTVHVTPRSGRVSAFLFDVRVKGLQSLGGDIVNPVGSPSSDLVIAGIPHQIIKGKAGSHVLRVLVPGAADANIKVDLISSDGVFTPVGLDGRDIPKGTVLDIPLNPTISSSTFALHIHSDQPIVASVYSPLTISGHRDYVWNTATSLLVPMKLAVNGLQPTLIFTGDAIGLKIQTRLNSGKFINSTVSGSDMAVWKAPNNSQMISIFNVRSGVYGAAVVTSTSGIGFFPLVPGSTVTRAAIPSSNISVINR